MSIQFGELQNLVRVYHRLLRLPAEGPSRSEQAGARGVDRVSISQEARELQQAPNAAGTAGAQPRAESRHRPESWDGELE